MPIPKTIEKYLTQGGKAFEAITHKTVFTAYDLAQTLKRELNTIAKTLVVKADGRYVLAVVPASARLNLAKLKKILKAKTISIPKENVMTKVFKVKPGAISSFGAFHKVETVVDKSLLKVKKIVLQAGSFTDSVVMKAQDFVKQEQAMLASFVEKAKFKKPPKPKKVKK